MLPLQGESTVEILSQHTINVINYILSVKVKSQQVDKLVLVELRPL